MPASNLPTRIVVTGNRASIERLISEAVLLRRSSAALKIVCTDGSINGTQAKYASEALSARIVAEKLAWPVSREDFSTALQRVGITHARADEYAGLLAAESSIRAKVEMPSDETAARAISALVNANPYLQLNITLVDAPPLEASPDPIVIEQTESPVAEGAYPPAALAPVEDVS
jgi:hypothetical protein